MKDFIKFDNHGISKVDIANITISLLDGHDYVGEFENSIREYFNSDYVLSSMDLSSAIHLALSSFGIKRGDKVFCPVNSHPLVPEAIRYFDAEPVFLDIDEDSLNISLSDIKDRFKEMPKKKIKGLINQYISGSMPDYKKIYDFADRNKLTVIENNTYLFGGQKDREDKPSFRVFAFEPYDYSPLFCSGISIFEDEKSYQKAKLLRHHGVIYKKDENRSAPRYMYDVLDVGNKYDLTQVNAALSLAKFKDLDRANSRKKEILEFYNKNLQGIKGVEIIKTDNYAPYGVYMVKIDKNRDHFAMELKNIGVETYVHFFPLHLSAYYKDKYNLKTNSYPNALKAYQQILSLPFHPKLSDSDISKVVDSIKEVAHKRF